MSFPRWAGWTESYAKGWHTKMNELLFDEGSPYRFAGSELLPIVSDEERHSADEAARHVGKYEIAAQHQAKALQKFSARPTPDYENAAKEAASAVESALTIANGKQLAVGDAIREFAKNRCVHPALMESANRLFGYASDRDGVRHGAKSSSNPVDFDEAKLVVVSASAWVNFIAAKAP